MKKIIFSCLVAVGLLSSIAGCAQQDKSKRSSPPDSVSQTTGNGLVITINYSQPSVKGRTIGKDIAPYGKIWRTGANEATTFEISKDAKVEGQALAAGKYGLYTLPGENEWTIIFNKTWKQWGTVYKTEEDALQVKVKPGKTKTAYEKLTFVIDKEGKVSLMWGDTQVDFNVK